MEREREGWKYNGSDLLDELITEGTGGTKALLLQSHVLFGLRVKARVLNQTVHKQPDVVLHLSSHTHTHTHTHTD